MSTLINRVLVRDGYFDEKLLNGMETSLPQRQSEEVGGFIRGFKFKQLDKVDSSTDDVRYRVDDFVYTNEGFCKICKLFLVENETRINRNNQNRPE